LSGVCRAIVDNQPDRMHTAPLGFWHHHLADKGLEVDKALTLVALPQNVPVTNTQASHQVSRPASCVARRLALRVTSNDRAWRLFGFTRLDRGFLIDTYQPFSTLQQAACLAIQLQDRTSPHHKRLWVVNVLPHAVTPRTDLFGPQPAPNRAGRQPGQCRLLGELLYQFGTAPARKRHARLARQTTGERHYRT